MIAGRVRLFLTGRFRWKAGLVRQAEIQIVCIESRMGGSRTVPTTP